MLNDKRTAYVIPLESFTMKTTEFDKRTFSKFQNEFTFINKNGENLPQVMFNAPVKSMPSPMRVYMENKPRIYVPSAIMQNSIIKQKKCFEMERINVAFVMPPMV